MEARSIVMDRNKFLLRMLASIFAVEAIFLGIAFTKCTPESCRSLGDRSETLFGVAVATTLALLKGR